MLLAQCGGCGGDACWRGRSSGYALQGWTCGHCSGHPFSFGLSCGLYIATQHPAAILSCGKGGMGSASMRSVLDPFQLKCSSFKLFFFLNKPQNSSLSAKPRATVPVKVQEPSVLNTICNLLVFCFFFFWYVQNAETFLKLNKQYYTKKKRNKQDFGIQ